MRTQRFYF